MKKESLKFFSTRDDLNNLIKNRDHLIKKIGQSNYERLVKKLENYIKKKGGIIPL